MSSCDSYLWNGNNYNISGVYDSLFTNLQGCDSLAILNLTINDIDTSIISVTSCDSYFWNGITYNISGIYDSLFTNLQGCDSLAILDLTLNYSSSSIFSDTACDTYIWDGIVYDTTGQYTNIYSDLNSCDSSVTINLTILNSYSSTFNISACDFYTWDGVAYNSTGVYTNIYNGTNNCDSSVSLNLIISNSDTSINTFTSCDSYFWNGTTYNIGGVYDSLFTSVQGCDSLVVLDLTINYSLSSIFSDTSCDSYSWDGVIYNTTGLYTNIYSNIFGCDSTVTLDLTITNSSSSSIIITACDSYTWDGTTYYLNGFYSNSYNAINGCDSIVTLILTIIDSDTSNSIVTSCDSYLWNGITYSLSGIYDTVLINSIGCDSLVILDLTITNSDTSNSLVSSCDLYLWNGLTYTQSGVYDSLFINSLGCDSLAILDLTITNSDTSNNIETSCNTYLWNGVIYTQSGVYDSLFVNSLGCDSLAILYLTITNSDTSISNIISCDLYQWNNILYTQSGVYDSLFTNSLGCDSLAILNLTITNSDTSNSVVISCDTYLWNGVVYNTSGIYDTSLITNEGCDSLAILDLTINYSSFSSFLDTACNSYSWDSTSFSSSGQYTNIYTSFNGCDSSVTLILTINNSDTSTSNITSCDSYIWNGTSYNVSGIYDSLLTNINDCDSLAILNLLITESDYTNIFVDACGFYFFGGTLLDTSGIYIDSLSNSFGCDSIVTLNLFITDNLSVSANIQDVECFGDLSGEIDLEILLGTPPYSFFWSNGAVTEDISQLNGDSIYSCLIVDSFGCDLDTLFYIDQSDELIVNENVFNILCFGENSGSISLDINGGVSPYVISWGSDSLSDLFAGYYNYSIIDSNGCLLIDSVQVFEEDQIQFSINYQNIQCFGDNTGSVDLNMVINSGFPPYQYNWSGPNSFTSNLEDLDNLFAGTYSLTITDANLCVLDTLFELIQPVNIPQINNFEISNYNSFNISCNGENDGWIKLNISGGYSPFSYLWTNQSIDDSIFNLPANTYSVNILDSLACLTVLDIDLLEPNELIVNLNITSEYNGYDVSCFNFNDGSIEAIVLGGVPSYSYVWSTGSFNDNIFNLIADNYLLTVEDANNCQVTDSISLVQPDSLFMDVILFPDTCRLGLGQAIVNVTGGTQPYSYNWSNGVSVNDFSNFFSGNYKLIVNDVNSCEINDSVSVANIPGPIIDFIIASEWEKLYEQLDDPIVFADKTDPNGQEILFWNWDFGDNYFSNDSIAYHSYADTGIYVVTLITQSSYNCLDTLSKEVKITDFNIFIPNAFTPFSTDDNLNDVFITYGVGITKFNMTIFNRWGGEIFNSNSIKIGWNGTSTNDEQLPTGIYLYIIEIENIYGQVYKYNGQVKLLR